MAAFDGPIDRLTSLAGRNAVPADFDAYWDRGLNEMEALGVDCELIPADVKWPNVEAFELWFTGVGGARIHARYVRPKHRVGKIPAVIKFHGYTQACGDFSPLLSWTAVGFACAAMECRGQGGESQDPGGVWGNTVHGHIIRGLKDPDPEKLYYRGVFLDAAQMARIVMSLPEVDETRVAAYGASQGGGLAIACAALTPRLGRAAFQMPFLCDYQRVWEMDMAKDGYLELQQYFRRYDPKHQNEAKIFERLGYVDCHNLAKRISCPVRMYTGLLDTVCPPSTQFAAYNNIQSPKSYQLYPDFWHEEYYPGQPDDLMTFFAEM